MVDGMVQLGATASAIGMVNPVTTVIRFRFLPSKRRAVRKAMQRTSVFIGLTLHEEQIILWA
eukprot:CAMPEP_0194325496 /NCGR_PEP_ID=MMETSP0171-20130528/30985_1 /TAXON_ID=218684 /ORGANISM="Corethron pennatum, Strain L29A3" /LENGTH=61 /DNA_ID=CAMNT_0039084667 /DNA_START=327 /DNA_END=512 /DNA_ORIENTATION=+